MDRLDPIGRDPPFDWCYAQGVRSGSVEMSRARWWWGGMAIALAACGGERAPGEYSPSTFRETPAVTPSGPTGDGHPSSADVLDDRQAAHGWGPSRCPDAASTGFDAGDTIPLGLTFRDEAGDPVQLQELCGAKAVWLYFAHIWCPPCQEAGRLSEELAQRYLDEEIVVIQVVVADEEDRIPDADDCQLWRREHDQIEALTLYDPIEAYIDLELADTTSLSVFLDENMRITRKFHGTDQDLYVESIEDAAGL